MKKKVSQVLMMALAALLVSCSPVKVVTDVDKSVDFTQYQTYSFLGWQEHSDKQLSDFDKKRIHDAFIAELKARGLSYAEEGGDIAISLFIVLDQKTSVTAYTDYYGTGGYGYGYRRYGGGWGYGSSTTTYSESDYIQGTLVMDAFDGKSKDQVWQGVATATVVEDPAKREKAIPKKVGALMAEFPVPVKE